MRESMYQAVVMGFDPSTGAITALVPALFGSQPQVIAPSLTRPADITRIAPVATNDRVWVFFPGRDDTPAVWMPTTRQPLQQGTVLAVYSDFNTISCDVSVGGSTTLRVPCLGHVLPVIGDGVWISDLGTTTQLVVGIARPTTPYSGRRRLNVNGSFAVAQRCTSFADTGARNDPANTTVHALPDNWVVANNVTATISEYRYHTQTGVGTGTNFLGSGNSIGVACQADSEFLDEWIVQPNAVVSPLNAGDYCILNTKIEGPDVGDLRWATAQAQPLTISFTAFVTTTITIVLEIQCTNPGATYFRSQAVTLIGGARRRYTMTFPGPTDTQPLSILTTTNVAALTFNFWVAAGSTYNTGNVANLNTAGWSNGPTVNTRAAGCSNFFAVTNSLQLSGVQVEIGSVPTPFEHRHYTEELLLCQRYFQRIYNPPLTGVFSSATVIGRAHMLLSPPMRAAPSLALGGGTIGAYDGTTSTTVASLGNNWSTAQSLETDVNTGGGNVIGRSGIVYNLGNNGYIDASAEM